MANTTYMCIEISLFTLHLQLIHVYIGVSNKLYAYVHVHVHVYNCHHCHHRLEVKVQQLEDEIAKAKQASQHVIATMVKTCTMYVSPLHVCYCYQQWVKPSNSARNVCLSMFIVHMLQDPVTLEKYQKLKAENGAIESVRFQCFYIHCTFMCYNEYA